MTFTQLALGAEIEVPTLFGREKYTVREGTQPGEEIRLRGKGFPYLNGRGSGDEILRITVEIPKNLTADQKRMLREFDGTTGEKNYQKSSKFREKWKRAFGG